MLRYIHYMGSEGAMNLSKNMAKKLSQFQIDTMLMIEKATGFPIGSIRMGMKGTGGAGGVAVTFAIQAPSIELLFKQQNLMWNKYRDAYCLLENEPRPYDYDKMKHGNPEHERIWKAHHDWQIRQSCYAKEKTANHRTFKPLIAAVLVENDQLLTNMKEIKKTPAISYSKHRMFRMTEMNYDVSPAVEVPSSWAAFGFKNVVRFKFKVIDIDRLAEKAQVSTEADYRPTDRLPEDYYTP